MSDRIKTYEELEHTAQLKLDIANAEREKDLATKNHIGELNQIKSGYDINGNKINCSVKERIELMGKSSKEYIKNYADHNEELISIETEIDDEEEPVKKNYIKNTKKREIKKRNWFGKVIVGTATAVALTTLAMTAIYCNHEGKVEAKIEKYTQDLETVVNDATYTRIGNLVYNNGEVVETLDDDKIANQEYRYIDYNDIANYIESSDNPDLAAFALYKEFGRSGNPEYHRIVTKTFKSLEFEGSEIGSDENFMKYLNGSGYEGYDDYYKACRKELYSDKDNELDNIKLKIKKMTK